jgi:phage tail-like protein
MPASSGPDHFGSSHFRVEIDGLASSSFAECTGLGTSVDVIEYREAGNALPLKLPGRSHVSDILLRRAVSQSPDLQQWHSNILRGVLDRRNGSVTLLDNTMAPVARWIFRNAFPRRWEGPELNAAGNDLAMETIVLSCEGIERA